MNRALVISDCDEVLLHMLLPWRAWLEATQGITMSMDMQDFSKSMRYANSGELVPTDEMWRLLDVFFTHEMDRQYPIAGAIEAMRTLSEHADVVILTNLVDRHQLARTRQLEDHGLKVRVFTNQGPKGPALRRILDEFQPSRAVFIDDIAQHHGSVAEIAPDVHRLHFCGEPTIAPLIRCAHEAGHAHARIDEWSAALPWLLGRLNGEHNE
ncbi:MAG: HAD family hydrolase [Pseudomonadota bacterium]